MSNYADLSFTDEEVITIYLFGIIDGQTKLTQIYEYTHRHLHDWFPKLPSYKAYVQRLNQVADVFAPFLEMIIGEQQMDRLDTAWLIDSFPVALAKLGPRFKAKVAPPIADVGYCSTKKLSYYGVRAQVIGRSQPGTLPWHEYIWMIGASDNDGKVFAQIRLVLHHNELYGDKAYQLPDEEEFWH